MCACAGVIPAGHKVTRYLRWTILRPKLKSLFQGAQPCSQTLILCPHVLGKWLPAARHKYTFTMVMFPSSKLMLPVTTGWCWTRFLSFLWSISAFRTLATNKHMLTCTCDHRYEYFLYSSGTHNLVHSTILVHINMVLLSVYNKHPGERVPHMFQYMCHSVLFSNCTDNN